LISPPQKNKSSSILRVQTRQSTRMSTASVSSDKMTPFICRGVKISSRRRRFLAVVQAIKDGEMKAFNPHSLGRPFRLFNPNASCFSSQTFCLRCRRLVPIVLITRGLVTRVLLLNCSHSEQARNASSLSSRLMALLWFVLVNSDVLTPLNHLSAQLGRQYPRTKQSPDYRYQQQRLYQAFQPVQGARAGVSISDRVFPPCQFYQLHRS
jgi:hypothetical protein